MQKKHIRNAQFILFMLIFTLTALGTASAADSLSDNPVTYVNHATFVGTTNYNTVAESEYTHNPKPIKPPKAALTTETASAEVIMTKTSNGIVYAGQKGTFTITLTNKGPNKAKNVIVRDPFITGFTYTPSTGKYDPNTGLWTIGTLANGATATLNITRTMQEADVGTTIYNTAIRNTNNLQPDTNNTTNSSPKDKPISTRNHDKNQ